MLACLAGCAALQGPVPGAQSLAPDALLATITVGRPPTLLAMNPDGARVVAASSGTLSIIDARTETVTATVPIPPYTQGVAVTPDGSHVLVSSLSGTQLVVVEAATGGLAPPVALMVEIPPGGFGRIAVSPDGRTAWVTNQPREYLAAADLTARRSVRSPLDLRPTDVTLGGDGRTLYVTGCKQFCTTGTVELIDTASQNTLRSFSVGPGPYRFALSPDGTRAYTTNLGGPSLSVVDVASGRVQATVPVGTEPTGLAVSPDGARIYVASQQSGTLTIVDGATNTVAATVALPSEPREVVVAPDGRRAYVSTRAGVLVLDAERL